MTSETLTADLTTAPAAAGAIVNRRALLDIVKHAAAVAPRSTPKPVLRCVRVSIGAGVVSVYATNLEASFCGTTEQADTHGPSGSAVVDARDLLATLKESPDETVRLDVVEHGVDVTGSMTRRRLPTLTDSNGKPDEKALDTMANLDGADNSLSHRAAFRCEVSAFVDALRYTLPATDTSVSRYALGGVAFFSRRDALDVVATDGHRLHLVELTPEIDNPEAFRQREPGSASRPVIVGVKTLDRVAKALPKMGTVSVAICGSEAEPRIEFAADGVVIVARPLDGRFPRYRDVIPQRAADALRVTVNAAELFRVAKAAKGFRTDDQRGAVVELAGDRLTLSRENVGSVACLASGDPVRFYTNSVFLIDAAKIDAKPSGLKYESIDAEFCTPGEDGFSEGAGVFRCRNKTALVMPLSRDR